MKQEKAIGIKKQIAEPGPDGAAWRAQTAQIGRPETSIFDRFYKVVRHGEMPCGL